jgi:hypothetical protein
MPAGLDELDTGGLHSRRIGRRGDATYFLAMWITSGVCFSLVMCVEAYGMYLAFRSV